jgi:4-O-beta-D-mannosyl-D-glucose phosphorylase
MSAASKKSRRTKSSADTGRLAKLIRRHEQLLRRRNRPVDEDNGVYVRYQYPAVTRDHVPLTWRYDFDPKSNPFLMERMGINSTFNPGAIVWDGKICLVVRVEGLDRKSFFAIAESPNGVDNFRFWPEPLTIPVTDDPETNVYDMRLTTHEDGWIYGVFCAERKDKTRPDDTSAARADAGIVRTHDLKTWQRLPDLKSVPQQRNVALHPEFVKGKYALYTRPADSFINTGSQCGIGFALVDSMERAEIREERIIDARVYHTIKEVKNGDGPTPLRTPAGWLHIAHGVRMHAGGLRYVLYAFMTDLKDPSKVIYTPGGHLVSALGHERSGDTPGNVFCSGAAQLKNGDVFIYYGSSDTRVDVVKTSIDRMVDYCKNTPPDGLISSKCVQQRTALLEKNCKVIESGKVSLLKKLK